MRLLFVLLTALLLAVALGWVLQQSSGEVVFTYGEWMIQASLLVFVIIAAALFLLVYALLRLLGKLLRAPADFRRWSDYRRRLRSGKLLNQGLLSMMEGDWQGAEQSFQKGAAISQAPLVNYLGAAQAAYRRGDPERCDRYLSLASRHDDTGSPAVGIARARLQLERQQVIQANDTLNSLEKRHEQVTLMLLETATEMRDWTRATGLLKECVRRGLMTTDQAKAKRVAFYVGLLRQAGEDGDNASPEDVWRKIPNRLKKESVLVGAYAGERLRRGDASDCEPMLRRALKRQWDPELVRLYGLVEGCNPKRQLEFAEGCLDRYPEDPALLLTLGRLCKRNHLWGKAKNYLEQSLQVLPDPVTCRDLATLLEQQGEHDAARACFERGLNLATGGQENAGACYGALT